VGWTTRVRFPVVKEFSSLGPTHPPLQWISVALTLVVKQPGYEADIVPPSGAEVKIHEAIPPLPHMSSWYGT